MLLQGFDDRAMKRPAEAGRLLNLVEQLRDFLESRGKPVGKTAPFLEIVEQVFVSVHRLNDLVQIVGAELLDSLAFGKGHYTKSTQSV
jgi:hypothetical protein